MDDPHRSQLTLDQGKLKMSKLGQYLKRPSIFHSVLFGVTGGMLPSSKIKSLLIKVKYFSSDYLSRQSRWNYLEKQQLYKRELGQQMNANYIASLAEEYDPVALRLPSGKLNDRDIL